MSAFIVDDKTINRVIEWLFWEVNKSTCLKENLESALGIDTAKYQWYAELGEDMFKLNIAGVNARYGEGEAKRFRELNYRYTLVHGSKVQVLKSLQCWLYQCMEGEVVKDPLYLFFREVVEPHLGRKAHPRKSAR